MTATMLAPKLSRRGRRELAIPLLVLLLIPYSLIATSGADADTMSTKVFNRWTYLPQDEIASYIRANSPDEATIYVAFYQTSLYHLADREAASSRFYYWELAASPTAQDDLIAMVESPERPIYIIRLPQRVPFSGDGAQFWHAVDAHYQAETMIDGITLYRAVSAGPSASSPMSH